MSSSQKSKFAIGSKPLLMLASMVLPMAREPRSLVSLDSYFLLFIMTHPEMMKSLYALVFLQRALVSIFLRKKLYKSLKFWQGNQADIWGKSSITYSHPKCIFVPFLYFFFQKTIYQFLLSMSFSGAKVTKKSVVFLLYLRKRSLCFSSTPTFQRATMWYRAHMY